jgi:hypothetical protein
VDFGRGAEADRARSRAFDQMTLSRVEVSKRTSLPAIALASPSRAITRIRCSPVGASVSSTASAASSARRSAAMVATSGRGASARTAAPMRTAPMATVVSRSASPAAASAAIMSAGSATTSVSASPRIAARWMLSP